MATVGVDRVLEAAKLRRPALLVLLCAASTLILDSFDIQAVGFTASLGGGLLLTLSGAGGFFACVAAVLLFTFVAVLLVRRQIAGRESSSQPSRASAAA